MNKVAIATLHFYNNFGSVLQAYALRKTIQNMTGGQVEILPYRPALPEYQYFQEEGLARRYIEKCSKFEDFRVIHLGMKVGRTGKLLQTAELEKAVRDCGVCVVGSDIVWGKEFSGLDPVYFLQFAPAGCRRIAYAASVLLDAKGATEEETLFAEYLPGFDAVAVRETSAVQSIQRFTDKRVLAVLDPTLLLEADSYEELVIENEEMKKEPYLLSYFLTHDPAVVDYTNLLAQKLGLRVIHYFADYPKRVFDSSAGCFAFAGPGEFLGYMKNAACIFTNSFHGTCFSMIYRKPFYTYTAKRAMLSRVRDMVGRLGMEERFFEDFRDIPKVTMEIDYMGMEERLQAERMSSLRFLKNALGTLEE